MMAKAKVTGKAGLALRKKTKQNEYTRQRYKQMSDKKRKARSAQVMAARAKRIGSSAEALANYKASKRQYYRTSKVKMLLSKTKGKGFTCFKTKSATLEK
jgi:hypothetical protein